MFKALMRRLHAIPVPILASVITVKHGNYVKSLYFIQKSLKIIVLNFCDIIGRLPIVPSLSLCL